MGSEMCIRDRCVHYDYRCTREGGAPALPARLRRLRSRQISMHHWCRHINLPAAARWPPLAGRRYASSIMICANSRSSISPSWSRSNSSIIAALRR